MYEIPGKSICGVKNTIGGQITSKGQGQLHFTIEQDTLLH